MIVLNELNNIFLDKVSAVVEEARKNVKTAVNIMMVYTYLEIGRIIVEEGQSGSNRAESIYWNDCYKPVAFQAEHRLYHADGKLHYEYNERCFDMDADAIRRMHSPDRFPSFISIEK